MNYKLTIQYDGTRYSGWQRLDGKNTIQGTIENVLSRLFEHKIEIHGAGRTDAGVHAKGQIANFKAYSGKTKEEISAYLNKYLPEDIAVCKTEEADENFHSRLLAKEKVYCYRILNSSVNDVFSRRFYWQIEEKLNIEAMQRGAEYFIGKHDFKAFCSNKKLKKSSVREIYNISIDKVGEELQLTYKGNGFLYNMVRIMTGTLVEIGQGKRKAEEIPAILESKDRQTAGITAPPKGLTLMEVIY